jgi:MoaA/NifB/PqqE/SkfB family radical SAM enzyme
MPPDLFERLCDELKRGGTEQLILEGEGEPLLHPHIFDVIALAKHRGFQVMLFTNGTLLDGRHLRSIVDSHLDVLKVSLWGATSPDYRQNYPGADPTGLEATAEALRILGHLRKGRERQPLRIELYHPINSVNFRNIESMVELAHGSGCDSMRFSPLSTSRGRFDEFSLGPSELDDLRRVLADAEGRLESLGIEHNIPETLAIYEIGKSVWRSLPCYIGWIGTRIRADGAVLPCNPCSMTMGDLKREAFGEIWNGSKYRDFRRRTITRQGLKSLGGKCDCDFCCHIGDNLKVHRFFKWLSPLRVRKESETAVNA